MPWFGTVRVAGLAGRARVARHLVGLFPLGRLLPQAPAIDGTVLQVGGRRCDLATASVVRVRWVNTVLTLAAARSTDVTMLF